MTKIATDLKQSEILAKILPIDSADMFYGTIAPYDYSDRMYDGGVEDIPLPKSAKKSSVLSADEYDGEIPAWSLIALLDALPDEIDDNHFLTLEREGNEYCCYEDNNGNSFKHCFADNSVDACVDMIILLNKKGLL